MLTALLMIVAIIDIMVRNCLWPALLKLGGKTTDVALTNPQMLVKRHAVLRVKVKRVGTRQDIMDSPCIMVLKYEKNLLRIQQG